MLANQFTNNVPDKLSNRIDRLASPPRKVPLPIVCTALSSFFVMFGGIFFSFGMIFVWAFGWNMHPIDEWRLAHSNASAPAIIEKVTRTNSTVNDEVVYEYRFRFNPGDGLPVYAHCYTTGPKWTEGERVVSHYLADNPDVACLEGARLTQFPIVLIIIVMIFPILGLVSLVPGAVSGWRKIKLLRWGLVTEAMNISSTTTNARINNIPVLGYAFKFRDRLGMEYKGVSKALPTDKIGDEAREPVLYLPDEPGQSMLVDALPLKFPLEVDENGQWHHHQGFLKPVLRFVFVWSLVLIQVVITVLIILGPR